MRTSYKTLTTAEYNVLNKIARRTKNDCWFVLNQDKHGKDYVWDWEEDKRMCLKTGVEILCDAIDCQENYDNCWLEDDEKTTFRSLLDKLKIRVNFDLDWGGNMTKEIMSADIVKVIGNYGIVKVKEKLFINGKPWKVSIWYDVCLDQGNGDIVISYRTLQTAAKWAKENQ